MLTFFNRGTNDYIDVSVIPTNIDRYLSINFRNVVFIDSYQIIPDKLSQSIPNVPPPAFELKKL